MSKLPGEEGGSPRRPRVDNMNYKGNVTDTIGYFGNAVLREGWIVFEDGSTLENMLADLGLAEGHRLVRFEFVVRSPVEGNVLERGGVPE